MPRFVPLTTERARDLISGKTPDYRALYEQIRTRPEKAEINELRDRIPDMVRRLKEMHDTLKRL